MNSNSTGPIGRELSTSPAAHLDAPRIIDAHPALG